MQAAKLRLQTIARDRRRSLAGSRSLVRASFALRGVALDLLDAARLEMERSAALVLEARTLLAQVEEAWSAYRHGRAVPAVPEPPPVVERERLGCLMSGCARPAPFRPCFVISQGIRRVLVGDMPVRVCSEHRVDLDALLQRPDVLDKLRKKLRVRGREEPDAVHVVFEVVN